MKKGYNLYINIGFKTSEYELTQYPDTHSGMRKRKIKFRKGKRGRDDI